MKPFWDTLIVIIFSVFVGSATSLASDLEREIYSEFNSVLEENADLRVYIESSENLEDSALALLEASELSASGPLLDAAETFILQCILVYVGQCLNVPDYADCPSSDPRYRAHVQSAEYPCARPCPYCGGSGK